MARGSSNRQQPLADEQEEMTVIVLKFKGGSQSLSRGFEAISQALAAAQLGGPPAVSRIGTKSRAAAIESHDESEQDSEPIDDEDIEEPAEDVTSRPARSSAPKKRPTPKFDSSLDLEQGDTLKGFCAKKNPQKDYSKYLVAAAWLTEQGGRPKLRANDLFSCFRGMGWHEQKDFTQPMRLMAAKKSYFESLGKGVWKLTPLGLGVANEVSEPTAEE
jgi:hypothetical protein